MNKRCIGFTLIELVIAIVMIGILSTTVAAGIDARLSHSVNVQADEFRRAISHTQLLAISEGVRYKLTVTQTGYSIYCLSATVSCPNPANAVTNVTLDDSPSIYFDVASRGNYYFDSLGRPVGATGSTLAPSAQPFTLTDGTRSVTVTMQPVTGFAN